MSYKLTYFSIRGLAEPIRLFLVDQDIKFIDDRIAKDDFSSIKSQFQFGQLPCLYDGDQQIVQSGAILRHLARKYNLNGENEMETTYIDMFCEGVRDLHVKYTRMIYMAYETEKDPYIKSILPGELAKFEKLLATRGNGRNLILGDKISYADYALFEELDVHQILDPHCLDKFPLLKVFHQRMKDRPKLKEYCEKRDAAKVPVNGNGKQ
uniref:Glutathione S-transferase 2 n=1 Tax=Onchocerca volvulus TaxID=6282 RepID=UPI00004B4FD5|nr:Chain A, Glutathione S-transferase 2 [Onchocerca volvulus]1TU7_B Chain B, Glutathione S-transferase 2 [Onchocerca volvulus]1TU8_A Chain A, Glutathione S-transferase 2 [Onchocerca volvulus]1TU8_B Chain B, Glutathione S-transferase 2 [Onchocerca volvulus]1TU8_C Chain C, Glutathione S-transferase 2 [Onchocerca volvulus]1TU8_D Chain D, Glutathione S-transferase 2 [Onchocerca volvulus]